mgnify:CR=1 FL=1
MCECKSSIQGPIGKRETTMAPYVLKRQNALLPGELERLIMAASKPQNAEIIEDSDTESTCGT